MSIVKFLECIPTEISVAIIGVLSVVVSSFLSIHISKATTIAEISAEKERREDTWKHEQESAYNAEFANMVTAVTAYLNEQTKENYGKAIEALNIIRVKEPTELSRRLDMLYYLITDKYDVELKLQQLEMELTTAVEQKRNNNCQYTAANH